MPPRRPHRIDPVLAETQDEVDGQVAMAGHNLHRSPAGAYCTCGTYLAAPDADPGVARKIQRTVHKPQVVVARDATIARRHGLATAGAQTAR